MSYVRTGDPEAVREALPDEAKAVVFVPVYEAYEDFVQCFASITVIRFSVNSFRILIRNSGFSSFGGVRDAKTLLCRTV